MRRGGGGLAVVAALLALTACTPSGATEADDTSPSPAVTSSASATPAVEHRPKVAPLPDGSRKLFPGHRIVAYYGEAGTSSLGVLGSASADGIWPRLAHQAEAYERHGIRVLPAYELITYVATGGGPKATLRESDAVIDRYARAAKRHHGLLILDIQPGHTDFLQDAKSLRRWLRLPYVGLALDPEWKLYPGEEPLEGIGHTNAAVVNRVSDWLNKLTVREHLPRKLLLLHEFTVDMVRHKQDVERRKHVAIVFNVDGFGSRAGKLAKYQRFTRHHRFPMGLKLFYDDDVDLMPPQRVLRLHPKPVVIDYQ
jgi:hypothetical protein